MSKEKKTIAAYVTKYALTRGILKVNGEVLVGWKLNRFKIKNREGHYRWLPKAEWFETEEEALFKAEEMRKKKIESLKKQIEKLKNLEIKVVEEM